MGRTVGGVLGFVPETYVDHLVYAAGSGLVNSVWVGGEQVMKDREVLTVDVEGARHAAQRAAIAVSERIA